MSISLETNAGMGVVNHSIKQGERERVNQFTKKKRKGGRRSGRGQDKVGVANKCNNRILKIRCDYRKAIVINKH